ncbi:PITH domain-containing protein [Malassezia restricta CBS 7877]|uniref:PITH domain-containing protein n=1 Tax=Malassezia restricta (strain ATCC 96810 / NBRC 103918 / CBS 7877) TaxID=425264 RepID=A0A3G2S0T2_MALR7|nr:PITH domain-containing protein [Malassezia restricta CBS 7877]
MECGGEATPQDLATQQGINAGSNLYAYIDHDRVWGVNIEPPESAKKACKPWDERQSLETWIESGVDDQMILHVPFTCPVCIESILLYPGRSDLSVRRCAAFVNRPNGIDFDDALAVLDGRLGPASTGRAQADFALLPGATDVTAYPVSVSRFSHTSSVSLLLLDSLAHTSSRMYYVGFIGKALDPRSDTLHRHDVPAETSATHKVDGVGSSLGAASTPSVR